MCPREWRSREATAPKVGARLFVSLVVAAVLGLPIRAAGQAAPSGSCVLGPGAPVRIKKDTATLHVTVARLLAAPAYTADIPLRSEALGCRLHVTPDPGTTAFRMEFRIDLVNAKDPAASLALQLVSDRATIAVSMDPVSMKSGDTRQADIRIEPLGAGAGEYSLVLQVSDSTTVTRLPFRLLWTPSPMLTLATGVRGCAADLCFYPDLRQQVNLDGQEAAEVVTRRHVQVAWVTAGTKGAFQQFDVALGQEGAFFTVPAAPAGATGMVVSFPLVYPRFVQGVLKDTVVRSYTVAESKRPERLAQFYYSSGQNEALAVLRGGSSGILVRLSTGAPAKSSGAAGNGSRPQDPASTLGLNLAADSTYELRERTMTGIGPAVAAFRVQSILGDTAAVGVLAPIAPTAGRSGRRDNPPELVFPGKGVRLRVNLVVLPATRIERVYVRQPWGDELNGHLHVGAKDVRLRLVGPGLGYVQGGELGSVPVVKQQSTPQRDTLDLKVSVNQEATATETLRLYDLDGAAVTADIPVDPATRQLKGYPFARLRYRLGTKRIDMPLPQERTPWNVTVSELGTLALLFNPDVIDADSLHGVQYLHLDVDLVDGAGNPRGKVQDLCVAVVPGAVAGRPYDPKGQCTIVTGGQFSIGDLIESSHRATAHSRLRIRLRHDPSMYVPRGDQDAREIEVVSKGWLIIEPRAQMPGPVMAFQRGRTVAGVTYTGALVNVQPLVPGLSDNWITNPTHTFSANAGFVVATMPSESPASNALTGHLSFTAGGNYIFRNMAGDFAFDLFVGKVWPISTRGLRRRDAYVVFRPGFSLPIGGSGH